MIEEPLSYLAVDILVIILKWMFSNNFDIAYNMVIILLLVLNRLFNMYRVSPQKRRPQTC